LAHFVRRGTPGARAPAGPGLAPPLEDCTDGVKVFHAGAAVAQNVRSPIVEREVRGTISSDVDAERNRLREATLLARFSWTAR